MGKLHHVTTRTVKRRLSGSRKREKRRGWRAQVRWSGCSRGERGSSGSKDWEALERVEGREGEGGLSSGAINLPTTSRVG